MRVQSRFFLISFLAATAIGCSQASGLSAPLIRTPEAPQAAADAPVVWGIWDVALNEDGQFDATPLRHTHFAVNAVGWIDSSPGSLGLSLVDIVHGSSYTDIILDISVTHPFSTKPELTGFDVCGVFMGIGGVPHPFDPSLIYGGTSAQQLLNPDGYTRWFNCPEFEATEPGIFGYRPGEMGSPGYEPNATLCPYKYFCDGLGPADDDCTYLVDNPASRGMFGAGVTNTRQYRLRFPTAGGIKFQYAVLARWAANIHAPDPPVVVPDDFPPEANATEAVAVAVLNNTSDMYWDGSSGGGNFIADLSIVNWNCHPGAGSVMEDYEIYVYSSAWSGGISPDMTASDSGDNYCTFSVNIPASPTASGPLNVWITVAHPALTYVNPFGSVSGADTSTLAAHFRYAAGVGTGGSEWEPPTDHDPRFLFIHHSTGEGFLFEGGMWDLLVDAGFDVHDRTYGDGWVGDNTDPQHWPVTFTEYYDDMITWELEPGQYYDIVAFKSCFPASDISSDEMLEEYKGYYNTVKSVTQQHPETLFIPFSTPPLVPDSTSPENAARAREFSIWLSGEYTAGEGNLVSYNVFDVLAGNDPLSGDFNCLRYEYQKDQYDSHPNALANETVAQDFTDWLVDVVWD